MLNRMLNPLLSLAYRHSFSPTPPKQTTQAAAEKYCSHTRAPDVLPTLRTQGTEQLEPFKVLYGGGGFDTF